MALDYDLHVAPHVNRLRHFFRFLPTFSCCSPRNVLVPAIVFICIFWIFTLFSYKNLPKTSVDVSTSSEVAKVDFFEEEDTIEPLNEEVFLSHKNFLGFYEIMERDFKVFVYPDEDPEIALHLPGQRCREHDSEAYFVNNLLECKLVTKDPDEAHLFFVPFSCQKWSEMRYPTTKARHVLMNFVHDLKFKYPYWNRTLGADHFYFACPGLGKIANATAQFLLKNSVRLVSSPTKHIEYRPHKEIALPQPGDSDGLPARAFDSRNRVMLNFWSAPSQSEVRDARKSAYENEQLGIWKDVLNWHYQMEWYRNIFCICPDELQAIGACITASIRLGCVPVVWSDGYDLPFNRILDWKKFSVVLIERDVSKVKKVLDDKDEAERDRLQRNVIDVQRHLRWNLSAKKQDAFHMAMYTLWAYRFVIRY